jgi:hypothetical protein
VNGIPKIRIVNGTARPPAFVLFRHLLFFGICSFLLAAEIPELQKDSVAAFQRLFLFTRTKSPTATLPLLLFAEKQGKMETEKERFFLI